MGFNAKGVKASLENLPQAPLPAITHTIFKEQYQHYVVIYKVHKGKISVMNPAYGKIETYTTEEFAKIWTGVTDITLNLTNILNNAMKRQVFTSVFTN